MSWSTRKCVRTRSIGHEIADAFVELRRAPQIREQEGEAGDLQALIDVQRFGAIEIAEGLVGEQPLCRQERPPLLEHIMQLVAGHPH